jgi:protein-S-isoprenylcysteine O-methyltransferase Ste14
MGYLLRHILSVLLLPATVAVVIPIWVARRYDVRVKWPDTPGELALVIAGVVALVPGLLLFGASLRQFFSAGRGTLAPWDPPRNLVIRGPYRYVRNPMISGVILILLGEALIMRSARHAAWGAMFLAINAVYIPVLEEPFLERRFGSDYLRYASHVGRLIPRLRPWRGEDPAQVEEPQE